MVVIAIWRILGYCWAVSQGIAVLILQMPHRDRMLLSLSLSLSFSLSLFSLSLSLPLPLSLPLSLSLSLSLSHTHTHTHIHDIHTHMLAHSVLFCTALIWHPIHEDMFCSGGSDGSILFWMSKLAHVFADFCYLDKKKKKMEKKNGN